MRKSLLRYFWNPEYVIGAILVMIMVRLLYVLSDVLPNGDDDTSFLNPIFGRIDFLNIRDVSVDATFAFKDKKFPDQRIVVVNVGEVAPTPDGKIALLLYKLKEWGAKIIGIDIFFDAEHFERFPDERKFEKEALKKALADVPNVVLVNGYDEATKKSIIPIDKDVTRAVKHFGYANFTLDDDDILRHFFPYRTIDGDRWLAFPLKVLEQFDRKYIEKFLELPEEQQIIYYASTFSEFQTPPIDDVLRDDSYKTLFKDKIVLIGFVNEGGLFYLGDTHKTPMGKKIVIEKPDGLKKVGVDGPDMPGILVHANIINMMLNQDFTFPVPAWADWLFLFIFSYGNIALYRVLRVKPRTKLGVGFLIGSFIITETIVVFFIPIITFFQLHTKISYHLMATSVLLFIPANAGIIKLRFALLNFRLSKKYRQLPKPVLAPLKYAFLDDETFPSYIGSIHASQMYLHYAFAIEAAKQQRNGRLDSGMIRYPQLREWRALLSSIEKICSSNGERDRWQQYFYFFLEGKKNQYLRDSEVKNLFLSTQYDHFNEHMYFEERDILIPRIFQMYERDLVEYRNYFLFHIDWEQRNSPRVQSVGFMTSTPRLDLSSITDPKNGLYACTASHPEQVFYLSPFCELCECKLHREKELFVYAGLLPKQIHLDPLPAYYGRTISCEPILSRSTIDWFRVHLIDEKNE